MSTTSKKTKKKLMPRGKKPESLAKSIKAIHEKYGEALARLAK